MTPILFAVLLSGVSMCTAQRDKSGVVVADYGVDCTFPIHSKDLKCGDRFGDRQKVYDDFMQGCRDHYRGRKAIRCDNTEDDRIEMSVRQPQSMVKYTATGFKKIRAPKEVMDMLLGHWERNRKDMKEEEWPAGNIYVYGRNFHILWLYGFIYVHLIPCS